MTSLMPRTDALNDSPSQENDQRSSDRRVVKDIVSANTNKFPIGLDTIRIEVVEFDIEPTADFTIRESANHSTGETFDVPLWRQSSGGPVTGQRASLNTDLAQITVHSIDHMSVQSSIPKVLYGDNVRPVSTPEEFARALEELETHLRKHGVKCRLMDCPVVRVDICRNVRTNAPISDFKESLRELDVPYLGAHDNGHEGMKWTSNQGNSTSQRHITLYNKSSEAGLEEPNIQRLEYRLQRSRVVKSQIGSLSTTELCEDLTRVQTVFRDIVEELFPEPPSHLEEKGAGYLSRSDASPSIDEDDQSAQITSTDIRPVLAAIRSERGSRCHSLNHVAWTLLWVTYPNPDQLWEAFKQAADSEDGPSNGKYRVRDKAEEARDYACMLDEDLKTEVERLAQLREKLLS